MRPDAHDARHDADVARLVSAVLPRGASWRIHDRSLHGPMNIVLDRAQRRLSVMPTVVRVDGGSPQLFFLAGRIPVVVWTTRHLEVTALVRAILANEALRSLRQDVARTAALAVMSEVSLSLGRYDQAITCLAASLVGGDWFLDPNLGDLEREPITESYVCLWFFGLAHELGHAREAEEFAIGPLSDDAILMTLAHVVRRLPVVRDDPAFLERLLRDAGSTRGSTTPSHIRGEAQADLFALEVLLDAIDPILEGVGSSAARPDRVIADLLLAHACLSFVERCVSFVRWSGAALSRGDAAHAVMHPAAFAVRQLVCRDYLTAHYAQTPHRISAEHFRVYERLIDDVVDELQPRVEAVDSGLAAAMRFVLDESIDHPDLMSRCARKLRGPGGALAKRTTRHFQRAARLHHGRSQALDDFLAMLV